MGVTTNAMLQIRQFKKLQLVGAFLGKMKARQHFLSQLSIIIFVNIFLKLHIILIKFRIIEDEQFKWFSHRWRAGQNPADSILGNTGSFSNSSRCRAECYSSQQRDVRILSDLIRRMVGVGGWSDKFCNAMTHSETKTK